MVGEEVSQSFWHTETGLRFPSHLLNFIVHALDPNIDLVVFQTESSMAENNIDLIRWGGGIKGENFTVCQCVS